MKVNTKADLQAAQASAKRARAAVGNLRAIIAKKTIRALFAGRLGIRQGRRRARG
jgi:membrane fusion protein (multidrug efflux system)